MRIFKIPAMYVGAIILLSACIKSKSPSGPPITTIDIKGTWYVDFYIAANIYASSPARRDTTYAKHSETWTLKGDSLYTHLWYSTNFDQTKSPPVFTESDTTELKSAFGGSYNGVQILAKGVSRTDTIDIISVTNSQLQIHQAMQPSRGFSDLYMVLKR